MDTVYILSVNTLLFVLLVSNQSILGRLIHYSNFVERQYGFLQEFGEYELPPVLRGTESYVMERRSPSVLADLRDPTRPEVFRDT